MAQTTHIKTFAYLAYLSLMPLIFALALAIYHAINIDSITDYTLAFAGINSYIFSHSYGALLLVFYAGIQIGMSLQIQSRWYAIFNFLLLWLAWISYQSFADARGMLLLLCCWTAAFLVDLRIKQSTSLPNGYGAFKLKINLIVLLSLSLILTINNKHLFSIT